MRAKSVFVVVILAVGSGSGTGNSARAASGTDYMAQALGEMMLAVRYLTDQTTLGYDDSGVCLVGVQLQEGASYNLERSFSAGINYVLIAGGDEDARDVDLQILDDNRVVVADTSQDRLAAIEFKPSRSGRYTIRLRLYDATRSSFCAFAVMQRHGYDIPVGNLAAAGDKFLGMCTAVGEIGDRNGLRVSFLDAPHQAAVWGAVLRGGESQTIRRIQLGGKPSFFLAAGDTQANDLDLHVKNSAGTVVGQDVRPDALAVVPQRPQPDRQYSVTVTNAERDGNATFALFGIVQVHE